MSNGAPTEIGPEQMRQVAGCACFNVRKAARTITQLYDDALRPVGLRGTQFSLLAMLRWRGPLAVNEFATAAAMDRTTLTRNLKPLERDGLIRGQPGEDRRVRELLLTGKGKRALERAFPLWKKVQSRVRRRVGAGQMDELVAGCGSVVESFRD